ncbi:MAG: NAD-binding protein [Halobacteriota archaeon]|nr:NAD-binding protein [Halobacteriota archaeon]
MRTRVRAQRISPIIIYGIGLLDLLLVYSALFLYLRAEFSGSDNDLVTAVYWVIQTITTLGYGEIHPISPLGRLLVTIIILSGIGAIFVFFPLVLTPWLERRIMQLPTQVRMSGHVVICGYSAIVETFIEELLRSNRWFVLVDGDEQIIRGLLERNLPCIYGDPSERKVLENACLSKARTLVANRGGEENASIILTASKLTEAKMIALVDDMAMERYLDYAGASVVLSPRQMLGTYMGRHALSPQVYQLMDVDRLHPELLFEEIILGSESEMIGSTIEGSRIRCETGATIIGIKKGENVLLNPDPDVTIDEGDLLFAIGSEDQLNMLDELITRKVSNTDRGLFILAGYGDVGKQISRMLYRKGVDFAIIDAHAVMSEEGVLEGLNIIEGDATDEDVLKIAGIEDASTFIAALDKDSLNIYTTIVARKLNPNIRIISRANSASAMDKLYDAGADKAFSLSAIGGKILARIIILHRDGEIILTDDLIVRVYKAKGELVNAKIGWLGIRTDIGCIIIGMDEEKGFIANPGPDVVISEGSELLVAGTRDELRRFERTYRYRNLFNRRRYSRYQG